MIGTTFRPPRDGGRGTRRHPVWAAAIAAVAVLAGCGVSAPPLARPAPATAPAGPTTSAPAPLVSSGSGASGATGSPRVPAGPTRSPQVSPAETKTPPTLLREGSTGEPVRALQRSLLALGYWLPPPDGVFGTATGQAVVALQKAAGLAPDGVVGPKTAAAIDAAIRPRPTTARGRWIEVDRTRQLLLLVDGGIVRWTFDTSTGSGAAYTVRGRRSVAVTPTGSYQVSRLVDGWDRSPLGELWRPAYFDGGIAIHGYPDVPAYPASHGCVRVGLEAMDWLWASGWVRPGTAVLVRR